ncbi:MAG: hypothetical protein FGF53_01055 [Candidatus Brockarchaeota archaeon]|nr:hypothetical protein [Candidatus Brockarchaeota archaeon]MBO3808121.1 hypothetical protein [Candidatus Brockarchaeota archaeon]
MMFKKTLAIILATLILTSHFGATLALRVHAEEIDPLTVLKEVEEELEKGKIPSGSITEANFIIPEGFPAELAERLWLFLAQLVSTGCSSDEIRRAIRDVNDTLKLPTRINYELKNYTIIPKYDETRVIQTDDGSVSVEIPYKVVDDSGKDVDVGSIKYESNGTSLFHVLRRYPKRRTYLVRAIDPNAYTLTLLDLKTGKVFNKTARINIGLFSNVSQNYFSFESFIVAVPGHFEETREAARSQVREFRVLLPAHDPLVVDTSISSMKVKVGDVITISAQIRNPQEAKNFKVLLGAEFLDKEAFEAWTSPPASISPRSGCPTIYLYLRPKKPGTYAITIYFAVVEPENLDVVFWNGEKTVTYVVTVSPEDPRLKVEVEAKTLAKFANLSITLTNTGGQEANNIRLLVTGDIEEKRLNISKIWYSWKGNVITKLLSPIAKVNVTAIYYDAEGKNYANTALTTISTTNFITPEEWRTYVVEVPGHEETGRVFVPGYQGATHVRFYLMRSDSMPSYASAGLSLIPISSDGFTLTLENTSDISKIASKTPEVRYVLLDVKPGFLSERILREDEVKKFFNIDEDEDLEPSKIPPGYEVKLLKEEVLSQFETVLVNDKFYEQLKYNNWEDCNYKYEDTEAKKWDLNKAISRVSHEKTIKLIYHLLVCQDDGLVKGILVKNYAAIDVAYDLDVLKGPMPEGSLGSATLSIPTYGSTPLNVVQQEGVDYPIFIRLRYQGRVVASLFVHTASGVSEFWRGFWDGVKEKIPGIIISTVILVIIGVTTGGAGAVLVAHVIGSAAGFVLHYVIGSRSNIEEIGNAWNAINFIDKLARDTRELGASFESRGWNEFASIAYEIVGHLEEEKTRLLTDTGLDLTVGITLTDILRAAGLEKASEYEKGYSTGKIVGTIASFIIYASTLRGLDNLKGSLASGSLLGTIKRALWNWVTPALMDAAVLGAKVGIAVSKWCSRIAFWRKVGADYEAYVLRITMPDGGGEEILNFIKENSEIFEKIVEIAGGKDEVLVKRLLNIFGKYLELSGGGKEVCIKVLERLGSVDEELVNKLVSWLETLSETTETGAKPFQEALRLLADENTASKVLDLLLKGKLDELNELLSKITVFEFGEKTITLKRGSVVKLWAKEFEKIEPDAYECVISWKYEWTYGEKSGTVEGTMSFPFTRSTKSREIHIPERVVDEALNAIENEIKKATGNKEVKVDEAKVLITEVKVYDLEPLFPKGFSSGGTYLELDTDNGIVKINGKSFKITHFEVKVSSDGRAYMDVGLECKNEYSGNTFILSFYKDGEIRIRLGDGSYAICKIKFNYETGLMAIKYSQVEEIWEARYSFNLKFLGEQMGKHDLAKLQIGRSIESITGMSLSGILFELLGYEAREELRGRIGKDVSEDNRVVLFVHFALKDGKEKVAYCGNKDFNVAVPENAKEITAIEIVAFRDLTDLKKCAIRVIEDSSNENKGKFGEAIANNKMDEIFNKFAEKLGLSAEELSQLKSKTKVVYHGLEGAGYPDFEIKATETVTIKGRTFEKDKRIAVIEAKYVGVPNEFGTQVSKAIGQVNSRFNDPEWTAPYGIIYVISWDSHQILNDEQPPSNVGGYKNPYIDVLVKNPNSEG